MLNSAQMTDALTLVHRMMVMTRFRAGTGTGKEDLKWIAENMDHAEYLVALIKDEKDQTETFWHYVELMGKESPAFANFIAQRRAAVSDLAEQTPLAA